MPTPVSMFKTDDGQLFASLNEAVVHEQRTFVSVGLTPLLTALLLLPARLQDPSIRALSEAEVTPIVADAIAHLAANRTMLQEFQKLFSKLQLTPTAPAAKKRTRQKRTPTPVPEERLPEAPQAAAYGPDDSPFAPDTGEPSSEHLADLESLAGSPITLPPTEDPAPPPPQA